jgi:glutathione S-transferase
MKDEPIYHLALPEDWAAAFETGEYRMSTRGLPLDAVGFIHASFGTQVEPTANRFYADVEQLVRLTIDPRKVPAEIREEPPERGSEERFPHISGPLPVEAVLVTHLWFRGPDGWRLDDLGGPPG